MIPPRVEHASGKRRPFPAERNARRNGRQPRQDDHDCDALVREHDNKAQHHQEQQLTDGRRDCSARRRYRQGEKHQKQLQAQQHGQARISDRILPVIKRYSLVVEDRSVHPARFCSHAIAEDLGDISL